ncbi:hypothetical protein [Brachybacterium sacelli]|uniref:Uncharacterized protein n=1 Tax=Brachybacterium sacelli TaxID=173364 RepID=A0ABS4WZ29_9MICO|nr:hypothetical protein [Brachybacterium sacelli]MBP2381470.1 hypothetical protein [Brachybacterium sacelli]
MSAPDLDAFCGLERLGLSSAQRFEGARVVGADEHVRSHHTSCGSSFVTVIIVLTSIGG